MIYRADGNELDIAEKKNIDQEESNEEGQGEEMDSGEQKNTEERVIDAKKPRKKKKKSGACLLL